jgi:hypothetical protein
MPVETTAEMKAQPESIGWEPEPGTSGVRSLPEVALAELPRRERDEITAPVPTQALLEAARAMTEPEPPADLGLYRALERSSESEEPPRSTRRLQAAPPLAAEFGLEHLLESEGKQSWALWLRSHGLWVAVGIMLVWLAVSFVARWLATPWP